MQTRPEGEQKQKAASGKTADGQNAGRQNDLGPFRHRSLKERADEYGGVLNLSPEIERDEPVGREIW